MPLISVRHADVTMVAGDVILLKYAQGFHGADRIVASRLALTQPGAPLGLAVGHHVAVGTQGALPASVAVFVGTPPLSRFDYAAVRDFGYAGLKAIAVAVPSARRVVMTTHGVNVGLDETEAFLALMAGLDDAIHEQIFAHDLEITIAESDSGRAERLGHLALARAGQRVQLGLETTAYESTRMEVWTTSNRKPHAFVAMPFSTGQTEDVFGFGIQQSVHGAGLLCERVDRTAYVGDCARPHQEAHLDSLGCHR